MPNSVIYNIKNMRYFKLKLHYFKSCEHVFRFEPQILILKLNEDNIKISKQVGI